MGPCCVNYDYGTSDYSNILTNDPLFVDMENGDYSLQMASPCIDAGNPSSDYDPDPDLTVADLGALYFDQNETPIYYGYCQYCYF